ncbi:MAG: type II toxin-antitoxin system Phd/YefM family antitoxin [Candidatus Rokuibacteriota bacterium]
MKAAAVFQLKSRLSHYLRRVKAGEEIVVTERGVPIARLVPIGARGDTHESLRDLERQGLMRVGSGKLPRNFWRLPRGRDPHALVRRGLVEEREGGR